MSARRYDHDYLEHVTLRDGTEVQLRLTRPDDREHIRRGFEELSSESRYKRFLSPKTELSEAELRYLSELDGDKHFALGAIAREGETEKGVGVGRFVRLREHGHIAEPAISVIDSFQGKGLGTVLLRHLIAAAKERGITRFQCTVLATNAPVQRLLDASDAEIVDRETSLGYSEVTLVLPDTASIETVRESTVHRLLTQAAGGSSAISLGRRLLALFRQRK